MFRRYFSALWEPWEGKMSGLISLALTLIATYSTFFAREHGIARARVYLWLAAGACFIYANYRAWATQTMQADRLQAALDNRGPKLILLLQDIIWQYDVESDRTFFFINAQVLNQGEPSIVLGWSAVYKVGRSQEQMQPLWLLESRGLIVKDRLITITNQELLSARTQEEQIERGGHRVGRLLFALPGDRRLQMSTNQFSIDVQCLDFLFTPSFANYTPRSQPLEEVIMHFKENVKRVPNLQ